jgi:predicted permease
MAERVSLLRTLIDGVRFDVGSAWRSLWRAPVVAFVSMVSIAIGVAGATSVFSLIDAVLVARLPVADPASIVVVARDDGRYGRGWSFTYPLFIRLRDSGVLREVSAATGAQVFVDDGARVEPAAGLLVSGGYFEMLGLTPAIGRLFTAGDDRTPGASPLVVLSHAYWQRRFGADKAVAGRVIRVTGHPMTVIGVAPERFRGLDGGAGPDVFLPLTMQAEVMAAPARFADARESWLVVTGRLPPGVTRAAVAARLDATLRGGDGGLRLDGDAPADRRLTLVDGGRGRPTFRDRLTPALAALGGLAAAILMLAWATVANLLLARTIGRQREISVRMTLGASRARVAAQLTTEGVLLASAGGALGIVTAGWAGRVLANLALPAGASPLVAEALAGPRTFGVAAMLVAATGAICGLVPALATRSTLLAAALRLDPRTTTGRRLLGRKLLLSAQVALAVLLLVGAGLFARTLANLRAVDVGVETTHLLTLRIDPTLTGYDLARVRRLHDEIVERVDAIPGVRSASVAMIPLLAGNGWGSGIRLDTGALDDRPGPDRNAVGPAYFATLGTPLIAGREFTRADTAAAPSVAIVNEAFADRYFGGAALGRRIGTGDDSRAATTIVGVVRDGKYAGVRDAAAPFWFVPYAQVDLGGGSDTVVRARRGVVTLQVRTAGDPAGVVADLRRAVAAVDRRVTVQDARPLRARLDDELGFERLMTQVAGAAAAASALLCALGLYGLLAYDVAARTREIGVRLALGASRRAVVALVVGQAAPLLGLGVATGLAVAVAASTSARALLFGLEPTDPLVLGAAVAVVLGLAVAATWLPARRAARLDPATALR